MLGGIFQNRVMVQKYRLFSKSYMQFSGNIWRNLQKITKFGYLILKVGLEGSRNLETTSWTSLKENEEN